MDARKIYCSKDSDFAYFRPEESEKPILFLEKEAKDLMKILNAKMISASCNFKTSKIEGSTKTDSSCQTLTSPNPTLSSPSGNTVDNTNDLEN